MKQMMALVLALPMVACSFHAEESSTSWSLGTAAPTPAAPAVKKPTCASADERKLFALEGTFTAGENDLALLSLSGQGWGDSDKSPKLWVRVPTVFAAHFPEDPPYTTSAIPLAFDDCGHVTTQPAAPTTLMTGPQVRYDLRLENDEPVEVKLLRGEEVLATLPLKRLAEPDASAAYRARVKPVVTAYLNHFRDRVNDWEWLESSAESGNTQNVLALIGREGISPDRFLEATKRAIRSGNLATVKTLVPRVSEEERRHLHCEVSTGSGLRAYGVNGQMAHDFQAMVPTDLETADILNYLLVSGSDFGPCGGSYDETRTDLIAQVADARTLKLLKKFPGIAQQRDDSKRSIFWLIFKNENLRNEGVDLAGYLDKLGLFANPDFVDRYWLTGPARWLTPEQYAGFANLKYLTPDMRKQARESIERDIESAEKTMREGEDFPTRYYGYHVWQRFQGKVY